VGGMTLSDLNTFCAGLPHSFRVIQWEDAHVWKIGVGARAKVFVIARSGDNGLAQVSFKCSQMSFDLLQDQPGLRPAPYLASCGMSWIQRTSDAWINDGILRDYIRESFRLVSLGLTKVEQQRLGLNQP
jgi:predicted DNA-binding protein (MmcQ/YjbR family)